MSFTLYDLGRAIPAWASVPLPAPHRARERLGPADALRHLLAQVLRGASALLARQARDIARPLHARQRRAALARDPLVEFHAEAGAPEGALYVDGRLVGWLDVTRL